MILNQYLIKCFYSGLKLCRLENVTEINMTFHKYYMYLYMHRHAVNSFMLNFNNGSRSNYRNYFFKTVSED